MSRFRLRPAAPALALFLALAAGGCADAGDPPAGTLQPVRFGLDGPESDACGSVGATLEDVMVRSAPSSTGAGVATLEAGAQVTLCEADGGWTGIVFPPAGAPNTDCEAGVLLDEPRAYDGPCPSGWVPEGSVEVLAG